MIQLVKCGGYNRVSHLQSEKPEAAAFGFSLLRLVNLENVILKILPINNHVIIHKKK